MRAVGRGLGSVLVAMVAIVVLPAAPAAAATQVSVSPGYERTFLAGRSFPVRVQVQTDRLVRGTVEVVAVGRDGPDTSTTVRLPAEIPGGSAKEFLVVVPVDAGPFTIDEFSVTARVVTGGRSLARSDPVPVRADPSLELVGLLPGALAGRPLPGPSKLSVDAGVARFAALGPAELNQAPGSLGPLSAIGVGADDLATLSPTARAGVLRWLGDGGLLLVDANPGEAVAGLPDAWQPGPEGFATAGRGRVLATAGAMAAGRFDGLVEPVPRPASAGNREFDGGVGDSLAADAGLRIPRLGWLLLFLLGYVVLIGPVTAVVLGRRGQHELAWIIIPLVAVLFTTGTFVGGRNLRTGTRLAHATMLESDAAGGAGTTFVGVAARDNQSPEIAFGPGWVARRASTGFSTEDRATVNVGAGGPRAVLPLDAGSFGVVVGRGPAPVGPALEVTAEAQADGSVTGTVSNLLDVEIEQVVARVGEVAVAVGNLAPGEEQEFSIQDQRTNPVFDGAFPRLLPEVRLWQQGHPRRGGGDGTVSLALWTATGPGSDPALRLGGMVLVAGWTRNQPPVVSVDDRGRQPVGTTAVTAVAPIGLAGPLVPIAVRVEAVRGQLRVEDFEPGHGTVLFSPDGHDGVLRFVLPPGAGARPLVATLPLAGAEPEVWVEGAWVPLGGIGGGADHRQPPAEQHTLDAVPLEEVEEQGRVRRRPGTVQGGGVIIFDDTIGPEHPGGQVAQYQLPPGSVVNGLVHLRVRDGLQGRVSSFSVSEAP